ncbi:MAG: ISKra4 family transposase [Acidobacteriota bacterium]|nr:ISKra4 family transposase [Acidobacteriota bacterium]
MKLITEFDSGETAMHDVAGWKRPEAFIKPASLGMSIKESKEIAASIQVQMVSGQVDRHNKALTVCRFCGQRVRTKGYYKSIFKSVFGKAPMRLRRVWGCECGGAENRTFSSLPTGKNPTSPELSYLTSKLAALMPFGKVADFLGELLPASAKTNATTVRNRVMRVGRRLEKAAAKAELPQPDTAVSEIVVGLDGGYVRGRSGPERNFEVVAGRVLANEMTTRFAFVRQGTGSASRRVRQAMIQAGCTEDAHVTVLSDGDAGLRAIQREVAPRSEHVLDWFHLAMRFQHAIQVARGLSLDAIKPIAKLWVTGRVDRAKWCLWNGKAEKGLHYLQAIGDWLTPARQQEAPGLARLSTALQDLLQYLKANGDSLPNYGKRFRADQPISTAWVESTVNEVIAKRMVKKQQMRWNRFTVQPFVTVRVHVLNNTLEETFRMRYANFRPSVAT